MKDLFGQALRDYFKGNKNTQLILHNKFSKPDILELDGYFFEPDELPDFDLIALNFCDGKILDVGAAAGRHSLFLQLSGKEVTANDLSPKCCDLMKKRGVKNIINQSIFDLNDQKFDTIFMLMNGLGITGSISGFQQFLNKASSLLNKDGIIVVDSADISYLNDKYKLPEKDYFGEIDYRYEYLNQKGDWFTWLYLDQEKLKEICLQCGWNAQIVFKDTDGQYLAIISK